MTIVIDTIQALIDHDQTLTVCCRPCNRHVRLDLDALGRRLGFGHSIMHDDLTPKFFCQKCGGKDIGLILSSGRADRAVPGRAG